MAKKAKKSKAKKVKKVSKGMPNWVMGDKGPRKLWCQFPYTSSELEKIKKHLASNSGVTLGDLAKSSILKTI